MAEAYYARPLTFAGQHLLDWAELDRTVFQAEFRNTRFLFAGTTERLAQRIDFTGPSGLRYKQRSLRLCTGPLDP